MVQRVAACALPDTWAVTVYFHPFFFLSLHPPQQEMLEWSKAEELNQALSLVLAIFHMDLEHLTHSLLLTLMPRLLLSTIHTHVLIDPHGFTLAKLCVLCITGTQTSKIGQKGGFPLGLSVCLSVGGCLVCLSVCLWVAGCLDCCLSFVRKMGGCLVCLSVCGWLLGLSVCGWLAAWSAACPSSERWMAAQSVCPSSEKWVAAQSVCPLSERWVAAQSVCVSVLHQKSGWLLSLSVCLSFIRKVGSCLVCVSLDRKVQSVCLSKFINRLRVLLRLTFKGAKRMDTYMYTYLCLFLQLLASVCIQIWFQIIVVDFFLVVLV